MKKTPQTNRARATTATLRRGAIRSSHAPKPAAPANITRQLVLAIARKLLTPVEYAGQFEPLGLDAQQALLAERLRAHRHLLILDNLESITGSALAIPNTLPPDERDALRRVLAAYRVRVGRCPAAWRDLAPVLRSARWPLDPAGAPLDPSAPVHRHTSKMGFDATVPLGASADRYNLVVVPGADQVSW